jgi:hydroxymethylpyrimidine/phosphomethylpyrimidine kinase
LVETVNLHAPLSKCAGLIRANLEALQSGQRVKCVAIGTLAAAQLNAINAERAAEEGTLPPILEEVIFFGSHAYQSRVLQDGYTIEDVVDQVMSAMDAQSVVVTSLRMTTIQNLIPRADRYGNQIRDKAVLECTRRHPKAELFTVVPKGDINKPKKQKSRP